MVSETSTAAGCLPVEFIEQIKLNSSGMEAVDFYETDEHGRTWITRENAEKSAEQAAVERHKNDMNIRLSDWGFPENKKDRKFILGHNFGDTLDNIISLCRAGKWIYCHGRAGTGKTASAARAVCELLRKKPAMKASFISVNSYILNIVSSGFSINNLNLSKVVLLDDFGMMNFGNEYNLRCIIDLIERLKNENTTVLITANYAIEYLYKKYRSMRDMEPLCDRLSSMCKPVYFKGISLRGRDE